MSSTTDPTMANADVLLAANPNLSKSDIQTYNISKTGYFKGTIAVCAIYGAFALFMLMLLLFSPQGSVFLSETFRIFTLTFIAGIIVVIILLVVQITTFKPSVLTQNPYDPEMCPDGWKLQKDTNLFTGTDKFLTSYKCVKSTSNEADIIKDMDVNKGNDSARAALMRWSANGQIGTIKGSGMDINCSKVYPTYLAAKNVQDTTVKNRPNALACEYANQCGIPWTSMCPNGQN